MIEFTVYGEPVAQGRPRASTQGGFVRLYDPAKSRDYKDYVRLAAAEHAPPKLLEGPLAVMIIAYRSIPKSFNKKRAALAEAGKIYPVSKPDADNYLKGVKDALKGVMWVDDSQVVDAYARKRYSHKPRIEVKIRQLGE
ncbi:RusA family crossover junction endodeoxyribonuclease [Paenibacillus hemerocallicola]|uniref:RusA family crossover junction endodeoxyribonuclease n=1 Tax=Paenibacillus hemerocallicola TaxID=1172614 RepID=A0A5C4TGH4_9BACL|nr:RusA family crossover junction endodeoxyribonuclease [Paenibacillus hemerocallicola]TNJ68203.1 RusA family crossover junction endodeoxyribonuclease [Paenibacillus hemerocallicola]